MIEVILKKFRDRDGIPNPDKIALVLKRPMVSSNKELKNELTTYLKRNFKGEYSADRAKRYQNQDYATFASEYNSKFEKKKKPVTLKANSARANATRSNATRANSARAAAPVSMSQLVRSRGSPTNIPNSFEERMALVNGNKAGSDLVNDLESAEADLDQAKYDDEPLSPLRRHVEKMKDKLKKHLSTRKRS